jgi:ATP-binding cassette subfamily B protein
VGAVLSDIITGNPTVKAFGSEKKEDSYFHEVAEEWRIKTNHSYRFTNDMDLVRFVLSTIMMAGMLGILYWLWLQGQATPGNVTFVITSYFMISGYLRDIGMYVSNLQKAMSEMEDVVFFWKTDIAVKDRTDSKTLIAQKGEVVFDNITFAYHNKDEPIYNDFSITITPGEKVALVGHSGSGKSTFVKLLQRLYDIQKGEIRIDGQNIGDVTQSSLRQTIALVPQDPILFHRTLRDNIAYARPEATQAEIIEAARKAYAYDFIKTLPKGFDTMVGERGIKLSGGERQRVAIARAILSDAPILILDEATSSLDSVSEDYIQKALAELMKGRTTITIAHRLSTIKDVDRILVFDNGSIVEQGTHEALLQKKESRYKELYDVQVMGFIGS